MRNDFIFEIGSWYVWSRGSSLEYGKYLRKTVTGYEFKPYFPCMAYSLIVGDDYMNGCSIAKFAGPTEYLELFT